ncbi:MAG TPA: hypothetical protein C5S50_10870 [Methanosarcinaceae archaeon]|nr:hypothetical protein [Methanosarcinaceae archaeon]
MNKLVFGIVLAVLIMLVSPVAAENVIYMEPSDISCDPGADVTDVWVMLNATDAVAGFQFHLMFEDDVVDVVNITSAVEGTSPDWTMWNWDWKVAEDGHHYLFVAGGSFSPSPGTLQLAKITLKGLSPGTRPLDFYIGFGDPTKLSDITGEPILLSVVNGTFTCGAAQPFTKSLPAGWNLISLPLTPTDNSVSAVLSGVDQNAVKQYNAVSNEFEDATTMNPGSAYFVHVATASTWEYVGESASSTTSELKSGLNMIGVPDCTMSVSDTMGATDYRYAARWNADLQSYEVLNPNAPDAFHGFTSMTAGEGYFVSAGSDSTLTVTCP